MKISKLLLILASMVPPFLNGYEFESLVTNSPFRSSKDTPFENFATSSNENTPDVNYELRGIFVKGNTKLFSIYNSSTGSFEWVKQGTQSGNITVDMFDLKTNTLYFHNLDGSKHSVKLKDAPTGLLEAGIVIK